MTTALTTRREAQQPLPGLQGLWGSWDGEAEAGKGAGVGLSVEPGWEELGCEWGRRVGHGLKMSESTPRQDATCRPAAGECGVWRGDVGTL